MSLADQPQPPPLIFARKSQPKLDTADVNTQPVVQNGGGGAKENSTLDPPNLEKPVAANLMDGDERERVEKVISVVNNGHVVTDGAKDDFLNVLKNGDFKQDKDFKDAQDDSTKCAYNCPQCESSFPSQREMDTHAACHTSDGIFPCSYCELTFKSKISLSNHARKHIHSLEPFPCKGCKKPFIFKESLEQHQKICPKLSASDKEKEKTDKLSSKKLERAKSLSRQWSDSGLPIKKRGRPSKAMSNGDSTLDAEDIEKEVVKEQKKVTEKKKSVPKTEQSSNSNADNDNGEVDIKMEPHSPAHHQDSPDVNNASSSNQRSQRRRMPPKWTENMVMNYEVASLAYSRRKSGDTESPPTEKKVEPKAKQPSKESINQAKSTPPMPAKIGKSENKKSLNTAKGSKKSVHAAVTKDAPSSAEESKPSVNGIKSEHHDATNDCKVKIMTMRLKPDSTAYIVTDEKLAQEKDEETKEKDTLASEGELKKTLAEAAKAEEISNNAEELKKSKSKVDEGEGDETANKKDEIAQESLPPPPNLKQDMLRTLQNPKESKDKIAQEAHKIIHKNEKEPVTAETAANNLPANPVPVVSTDPPRVSLRQKRLFLNEDKQIKKGSPPAQRTVVLKAPNPNKSQDGLVTPVLKSIPKLTVIPPQADNKVFVGELPRPPPLTEKPLPKGKSTRSEQIKSTRSEQIVVDVKGKSTRSEAAEEIIVEVKEKPLPKGKSTRSEQIVVEVNCSTQPQPKQIASPKAASPVVVSSYSTRNRNRASDTSGVSIVTSKPLPPLVSAEIAAIKFKSAPPRLTKGSPTPTSSIATSVIRENLSRPNTRKRKFSIGGDDELKNSKLEKTTNELNNENVEKKSPSPVPVPQNGPSPKRLRQSPKKVVSNEPPKIDLQSVIKEEKMEIPQENSIEEKQTGTFNNTDQIVNAADNPNPTMTPQVGKTFQGMPRLLNQSDVVIPPDFIEEDETDSSDSDDPDFADLDIHPPPPSSSGRRNSSEVYIKDVAIRFLANKISNKNMLRIRQELLTLKQSGNYFKLTKTAPLAAGLVHDMFCQILEQQPPSSSASASGAEIP